MAIIPAHKGPVNPAQVKAALGSESCTVRDNGDGTFEIEVEDVTTPDLLAALGSITHDPAYGATLPTSAEKLAVVGLTPAELLSLVETAQAEKAG